MLRHVQTCFLAVAVGEYKTGPANHSLITLQLEISSLWTTSARTQKHILPVLFPHSQVNLSIWPYDVWPFGLTRGKLWILTQLMTLPQFSMCRAELPTAKCAINFNHRTEFQSKANVTVLAANALNRLCNIPLSEYNKSLHQRVLNEVLLE